MLEQTRPTLYRATPVERHKDIREQQAAEWVVVNLTSRSDKIADCRLATATPVDLRPLVKLNYITITRATFATQDAYYI